MIKAKTLSTALAILSLVATGAFVRTNSGWPYPIRNSGVFRQAVVQLRVPAIAQSKTTSCGEAAIAMVYDYAHPEDAIGERAIIGYAEGQGLYTADSAPLTSPANMVLLAQHYAGDVSTGHVNSQDQGLELLAERLDSGGPVVIDITTRLNDPESGTHFVVVTGLSMDGLNANATISHNNPLTGRTESTDWSASQGVWQAWQNNGDPGGSGWWLAIPSSEPICLP